MKMQKYFSTIEANTKMKYRHAERSRSVTIHNESCLVSARHDINPPFLGWLIVILAMVSLQGAAAQWNVQTNLNMMYDNNINNNYLQTQDKITMVTGQIGHGWEGEESNIQLFYDGSFNYYQTVLARTNQTHSLNIEYLKFLGDDGEDMFHLSGTYGSSSFRDEYTFYDHQILTASAFYKQFLSERIINKLGYTFRNYSFTNVSGFSYVKHAAFAHFAFALPTNTTLITQVDLGTKIYTEDLVNSSSSRRGALSSLIPSVTQVIGTLRAGQRLTDETGLSASLRYQYNLQKQSRYLTSEEGYMISDDELFDDHYGYEGLHSTLSLIHLLTETVTLKATGGFMEKQYSSLPAFDLSGTLVADQRKDTRSYINLLFQKDFVDLGFAVKAALDLIENTSNDPFYSYSNTAVTVEIVVPW